MNVRSAVAALLLLSAPAVFAADHSFERTLRVSASPEVRVHTGSGFIHLHAGPDGQLHVVAHLRASHGFFSGDVEERMNQIVAHPPIEQNGNSVVIGQDHGFSDLYRDISIDYDVALPRNSAIGVATGSGEIAVEGVGMTLKATTGSGSLRAQGVRGDSQLQTGSGDIEFSEAGPGDVRAQTGSGSMHLEGVQGALWASTGSGQIAVSGDPVRDWSLRTGSGPIELNVGPQARFRLDASCGSGGIQVDQPMMVQGSLERHHVSGSVNGGGPLVRAETGSGGIHIR